MTLEPDRGQIEIFVDAMFRHAGSEGYASIRSFFADNAVSRISTAKLKGGLRHLIEVAEDDARRAANDPKPVVFCPPIAVFNGPDGWRARQEDLLKGLALSAEIDQHPDEALNRLEEIIGPATLIVKSGGQWLDPDDTPRDKLHLHWRLNRPAMGDQLARLKQARRLAAAIVGADTSNIPTVHCLRWPGSWHRKSAPRLCEIAMAAPDAEIDLDEALELLEVAAPKPARAKGHDSSEANPAQWGELAASIIAGTKLHESLTRLAAKYARSGTPKGAGINQARALMDASAARHDRPAEWKARIDDIPRAFDTAYNKYQGPPPPPPTDEDEPAPPPPPPPSAAPPIEIRVGETARVVNELERRLIASNLGLYQRGGIIVSTGFTKMPTHDGGEVITQIIDKRGDHALVEDAEAVAEFRQLNKKGKMAPCTPPMRLIYTLKDRGHRLRFPVLTGIVNCPSISARGELLDRPGFDRDTGILFDPLGVTFPRVPDLPTRADAVKALARLLELLATFDFVGPRDLTVANNDRAVALSLILTAVARRGLPFAPLHGFDAPTAGSGKSKIVDLASIISTGHEAGVVALGKSEEETHKTLSSLLMRGDPFIAIDNCDGPLEGALLNQMLTKQQVELRVLGYSKMVTVLICAVVTATGNNLVLLGDLTRRGVVARLDPKVARPELRKFEYDPIDDAKRNRPELVVAALTVLKAYHNAGRPNRPSPLQSFTDWSDTVRGALIWLGAGDPVKTMDRLRSTDPTLVNLRAVLTVWRDQFGADPITTAAVIARAEESVSFTIEGTDERRARPAHPLLRDALLQVAERSGKINTRALGAWLGKNAGRIVDIGEKLAPDEVALEEGPLLHGSRRWQVVQNKRGE